MRRLFLTRSLSEDRTRDSSIRSAACQQAGKNVEGSQKDCLASFLFFALSLSDAIGNLPDPLSSPSSTFSLATTFVLPVALMVGGLTRLMTALIMIASE